MKPEAGSGYLQMRLLDALGREVKSLYRGLAPADGRILLDVSNMPEALYLLEVINTAGRIVKQLVKH